MQLGMIGLGRMGANLVRRAMAAGHECVVFDHDTAAVDALAAAGAVGATSVADLAAKLDASARGLADGARRASPARSSTTWPRTSTPATRSSTAATRTTSTTSRARTRSHRGASTTSTAARAAACSDWSAASA